MVQKEATARIKINRLLEQAGWRFSDIRAVLLTIPFALGATAILAQESAEWSRSPGMNSATLAVGDQYELVGSAATSSGGNLLVITHWKRRSDIGIDAALGGPQVLLRCLDVYDLELNLTGLTCFVPLR